MTVKFLEPGGDATFNAAATTAGGFWGSITGSPAVATDFVRGNHIKSIKYRPANGDAVLTPTGVLADSGSRYSFWIYLNVLPNATSTIAGDNNSVVRIRITSAGVIQLWNATVQLGTDGATLSTGQWYRISLAYTITSTTVNRFELFKDGSSSISLTNVTLGSTGTDVFRIGNISANANLDFRSSDHYVDNSNALTDPGSIKVAAKRPFSNGSLNEFTTQIGSGNSGYGSGHADEVNERALSTTNGWSIQSASLKTEEYTIESISQGDRDLTGATIIDFVGWIYAKSAGGTAGHLILAGATFGATFSTAYGMFTAVAGSTTYPAGNTDIGIDNNSNNSGIYSLAECGILVAYILDSSPSSSPSASISLSPSVSVSPSASSSVSASVSPSDSPSVSLSPSVSVSLSPSVSVSASISLSPSSSVSLSPSPSQSVSSSISSSPSSSQSPSSSVSLSISKSPSSSTSLSPSASPSPSSSISSSISKSPSSSQSPSSSISLSISLSPSASQSPSSSVSSSISPSPSASISSSRSSSVSRSPSPSTTSNALQDGLVSYYKMQGDSTDSIGTNNGTDTSMTYATGDGKLGQGAHFSGSGHIDKTSATGLPSGANNRTIAFWFKGSSTLQQTIVMWGGTTSGQGNDIVVEPTSGNLGFIGFSADLDSGINITNGNFHFCVITYDGTTLKSYVDNVAGATAARVLNTTGADLHIGIRSDAGDNTLAGSVDELGIWSRVLSLTEISNLWNGGNGLAYPLEVSSPSSSQSPSSSVSSSVSLSPSPSSSVSSSISFSPSSSASPSSSISQSASSSVSPSASISPSPSPAQWSNQTKNQSVWTNQVKMSQ